MTHDGAPCTYCKIPTIKVSPYGWLCLHCGASRGEHKPTEAQHGG